MPSFVAEMRHLQETLNAKLEEGGTACAGRPTGFISEGILAEGATPNGVPLITSTEATPNGIPPQDRHRIKNAQEAPSPSASLLGRGGSTSQLLRRQGCKHQRPSTNGEGEDTPPAGRVSFDTRSFMSERVDAEITTRYEIEGREIGVGGGGRVYQAKDRRFQNRRVAIKQVQKPEGPGRMEALEREVKIMKELDHPCICRLFETYDKGRFMFFVMELCAGGDLFDRFMEDGRISAHIVVEIVKQTVGALRYAHSRGIAHRDLKLENICFCSPAAGSSGMAAPEAPPPETAPLPEDATGTMTSCSSYQDLGAAAHIKVIDWGFGKFFEQAKMRSNVGTSSYAAPEVVAPGKEDDGYTSACDLWSLAVVAYVSLCGKPPFWGPPKEQLRKMKAGEYPMEEGVWTEVSFEAKDFIRRLLKWDARERLTAGDALEHPWLAAKRSRVESTLLTQVLSNVEQFSRAPDFYSLCVASVARQVDHCSLYGIREVFCYLDTNCDGVIDVHEMQEGFRRAFGNDSDMAEVEEMFSKLNLDGSCRITFTEFCAAGLGEQIFLQEHVLWAAFKTFDIQDNGRITVQEMQHVLTTADVNRVWSTKVCSEVARELVNEFNSGDDGVTFQDWSEWMKENSIRHQESVPKRMSMTPMDSVSLESLPFFVSLESLPSLAFESEGRDSPSLIREPEQVREPDQAREPDQVREPAQVREQQRELRGIERAESCIIS